MIFKSVRTLLAASMLLLSAGCEGFSVFMPEPTPTPSPTAPSTPTRTPAPTPTITPSPVPRQLILGSVPSPDGRWLAVVDDVGVCVYDLTSYREVWRAPVIGLLDDLYFDQVQIAWADDSTALTVSIGKVVYETEVRSVSHLSRFDAASGRLLWQQSFEDRPNVSFSPDGSRFLLASGYSDVAELWDGLVPERTGALELPPYAVLTLPRTRNWSPDGSLIAGKLSLTSPTPAARITEGILSFTEGLTEERSIFVWDAVTGKLVTRLRDPRQGPSFHRLGWARDGSTLISDENGRFILWDTQAWAYQSQIVYDAPFNSATIELSPDGTRLVSLLQHRSFDMDTRFAIYAWEIPSGKPLPAAGVALFSAPKSNPLNFVGWMPDGNSCLYKVDGQIVTLDATQGQLGEPFPIPEWDLSAWTSVDNYFYIDHYQLSADGKHIYFVEPKAVTVYDAQTGEVIARLTD